MRPRTGVIRVIGGDLRGRRLHAPRGEETRPTAARAREGLFGWLGPCVEDAQVLDVFAGTGALGIEAASRGAAHVLFIERSGAALACLRKNLQELKLCERTRVVSGEVERALRQLRAEGPRFDLILADPPYADAIDCTRPASAWAALLEPDGVLILERRTRGPGAAAEAAALEGLALLGSRRYGQTAFDWYGHTTGEGMRGGQGSEATSPEPSPDGADAEDEAPGGGEDDGEAGR